MLALITGTGFYDLDGLEDPVERSVDTPWGSVTVTQARWRGQAPVLFLPRHGSDHSIAPHRINYRANIAGLVEAGATAILTTAVSGGIADHLEPGTLTLVDDFIDFTSGRAGTFHDTAGDVHHVDVSDPYDPGLRALLAAAAEDVGVTLFDGGVYCATNGPRFETRAEIAMMRMVGGDLVGMTGCPEVVLANERAVPYAAVGVIVNRAVGLADVELSLDEIHAALAETKPKVEALFGAAIERWVA